VAAALVEMSMAEGRASAVGDIQRWEEILLASVQRDGRVREVRAVLENNLRAGRPWRDALMGLAMFAQGIFRLEDVLAGPAQGQPAVARIFENVRRHGEEGQAPPPSGAQRGEPEGAGQEAR